MVKKNMIEDLARKIIHWPGLDIEKKKDEFGNYLYETRFYILNEKDLRKIISELCHNISHGSIIEL
jgi:hypothetical protein